MQETQARDMSEKLKEDYEGSVKQGNLGHFTGFYQEKPKCVAESYDFKEGRYTLRSRHLNKNTGSSKEKIFYWWNYNAIG